MKVHILYSLPHYGEHLKAIWKHLPESLRGGERIGPTASDKMLTEGDVVMVASSVDIDRVQNHRIIYVEHGAGQSYRGLKPIAAVSYHGSTHPERVVAYIAPRQKVADSWGRPAFAAGSPICDPYPLTTGNTHPAVAITMHWHCNVTRETRSAFEHYGDHLEPLVHKLRNDGFVVLGHHHPKDRRLPTAWRNLGVEVVSAATVRESADLLICDNSSIMYEMAYLNRRVVALNAPWFRRDVEHGLRFWEFVPGHQVDTPEELMDLDFDQQMRRPMDLEAAAATGAYDRPWSDGNDGFQAACWVTAFVAGM